METAYTAGAVDDDSDGHLDAASRELVQDASIDRNGDGNPEVASREFRGFYEPTPLAPR